MGIEAAGIERRYDDSDVFALRGVDLSVADGETVAILGASGSGKSTLLHILGALDRPTAGTVHVDGRDIVQASERERTLYRRRECGFVFQSFFLVPSMTVGENVAVTAVVGGERRWSERAARLLAALGLEGAADRLPQELSGGQRQRVAVARALFARPKVVLADEPTGSLDSTTGRAVLDLLHEHVRAQGNGCLITVTHDLTVAARSERVVLLSDGRVAGEMRLGGDPHEQLRAWLETVTP
ncbi:ABC transporter ATP-binding protein [Leifsonia aquatica]|uniref:ABC transporter ATP-binding protein n=1 Tax=Leifsonia aquatica TaxID=144185 RepID=UPI00384CF396